MSNKLDIEKIKKEKKGIDILADIYLHAVFSEKLSPENLERIKLYGIYAQDEKQEFFQIKIPLNMGQLNLEQIKIISQIAKDYSDDFINLSSEQRILLKNIKLHNIPNIFNLLQSSELNTSFEAGHTVRRVLTCPINGIDETQLFDVSDLANRLNKTFIANEDFYNLPNKLQMAISGYEEGCNTEFSPDVSFNATKNSKDVVVFAVKILNKTIGYISRTQVLNTAKSIANIYKDFGDRQNSEKNSFEDLVNNWGLNKFYDILNASINYKIERNIFTKNDIKPKKPRLGINASKIEGESYVGCKLENTTFKSSVFDSLHLILEKHDASKIKITHKENIIILDVPSKNVDNLAKELHEIGFNPFK